MKEMEREISHPLDYFSHAVDSQGSAMTNPGTLKFILISNNVSRSLKTSSITCQDILAGSCSGSLLAHWASIMEQGV